MTLDLNIQSELLPNFEFEIKGSNFKENISRISQEFYKSRSLKLVKILIDGSPFAFQNELANMLANYFHLHHVKNKCFLKNFISRLDIKISNAENYKSKMEEVVKICEGENVVNNVNAMMEKAQENLNQWNDKIKNIREILDEFENVSFDQKKEFVKERLSSPACSKNQGYVMNGFELTTEGASHLFLNEKGDLNESKPDFVIILNRMMEMDSECLEIEGRSEAKDEKKLEQWKLKDY